MRISSVRWRPLSIAAIMLAAILIPFVLVADRLETWTVRALDASASHPRVVAALIVALLVADVALPIPSSIVSTTAGLLLGFGGGLAASAVGMTLGATVAYGVGRWSSRAARRFVSEEENQRLGAAFGRYGDWLVVLTRAVPVLAESTPVVAGMARMPFGRFFLVAGCASMGVSAVYALIGASAAHTGSFLLVFLGSLVAPLGPMLWLRRKDRVAFGGRSEVRSEELGARS